MARDIHIANDFVVAGRIRESGINEKNIVLAADSLSHGPVLPIQPPGQSTDRRMFWADFLVGADAPNIPDAFNAIYNSLGDLTRAEAIYLWVGPSLDEQLFFIWSVAVLNDLGIGGDKLSCISIVNDPADGRSIQSLEALSPTGFSIAKTLGKRLAASEFKFISKAWEALTSSDPVALDNFRKQQTGPFPLMVERLGLLVRRYPLLGKGLSQLDLNLLQFCKDHGPRGITIFAKYLVTFSNHPDRIGDHILCGRLQKLSSPRLHHPLIQIEGNLADLRTVNIQLTPSGNAVLAGEVNNIKLNGADEWIGGVHLAVPPGKTWLYDPVNDELVRN